ncbi:uncharacterized protein BXZ73DRAFT_102541 [Epithele typhae]|uniref:uncharacterized protein n=1 Tax=Epithele typhae TaxID=378194 RepID=UPI0020084700|nr:uncharacterized protein BXZ73DRAFT_102541 [Epithele typhae]KAH9928036.1 hypothetical protein BXZ73DRAFT_102541 [Epithele typhae]
MLASYFPSPPSVPDRASAVIDPSPRTVIRVLTSIFSKYLREHDHAFHNKVHDHKCNVGIYDLISNALAIHQDGAVAVTGKTLPDGVHLAIGVTSEVTRTGHPLHSVSPSDEKVDLVKFYWNETPIPMRRHVSDFLRVLTGYKEGRLAKMVTRDTDELTICGWVTSRRYDAAVRRINLGHSFWSEPVWEKMQKWTPTKLDSKTLAGVRDTKIDLLPDDMKWVLALIDLKALPETHFTEDAAGIWIKILGLLLACAYEDSKKKVSRDEMEDQRCCFVQCLRLMFLILGCEAVKVAFQLPSLSDIFVTKPVDSRHAPWPTQPTPASLYAPRTSCQQDASTSGVEGSSQGSQEELENNEDRCALTPEPGETPGHVVFRYLLMVVSPFKASLAILNNIARLPSVPQVSILELRKEAKTNTQEDYDEVLKVLSARIAKCNTSPELVRTATSWLRDVFRDNREGPVPLVHVEAELMSFLNTEPPPDSPQSVRDLYQDLVQGNPSLAIGASRKACYGCTKLREQLCENENSKPIPWDPPAFGIPDDALARIAEGLQTKVADMTMWRARALLAESCAPSPSRSQEGTSKAKPLLRNEPEAKEMKASRERLIQTRIREKMAVLMERKAEAEAEGKGMQHDEDPSSWEEEMKSLEGKLKSWEEAIASLK